MEFFPYLSSYLLVFSFVICIFSSFAPLPFGKFSNATLPLQLNSRVIKGLFTVGVFSMLFGWSEDNKWYTTLPSETKGWIVFLVVLIYFVWRSILSHLFFHHLTDSSNEDIVGKKNASFLLVFVGFAYYVPAGFLFRRLSVNLKGEIRDYEYLFLVASLVCFTLNAYVDVVMNIDRSTRKKISEYYGRYASIDELREYFDSIVTVGLPPNYFFEIAGWFFFSLFVSTWETFWWFLSVLLFLLPRSMWQMRWYYTSTPKEIVVRVPPVKQINFKSKINF